MADWVLADSVSAMAAEVEEQATAEQVERAKRSMSSFKGMVNTKLKLVQGHREVLVEAAGKDDPNDKAIAAIAKDLQSGLQSLLDIVQRYQVSQDKYLIMGKDTEEANKSFFQELDKAPFTLINQVMAEQKLSTEEICRVSPRDGPTPQASGQATKVVKVEKELKPDHKLDEGDTLDAYTTWIAQFKTYFSLSNFSLATPEIQRVFLSKCLSEGLWKRISGGETPDERK